MIRTVFPDGISIGSSLLSPIPIQFASEVFRQIKCTNRATDLETAIRYMLFGIFFWRKGGLVLNSTLRVSPEKNLRSLTKKVMDCRAIHAFSRI